MGEALPDGICRSSPNLWHIAAIPEAGLRQTMVWPPGTTSRWAVDTSSRRLRACVERRRPAIAMAPDHYERGPDTAIMDQDMRCVLGVGHDQILVPVLRGDHRPWDPHIQGPLSATEGPFWCKFVPHRGSHPEAQNFDEGRHFGSIGELLVEGLDVPKQMAITATYSHLALWSASRSRGIRANYRKHGYP
jgi:hypothetical protein